MLGDGLVGLYLYGSMVTGDFDDHISDVDLLAVITAPLNEDEFRRLDAVHRSVEQHHPEWSDRIEIAYPSKEALATLKQARSSITPSSSAGSADGSARPITLRPFAS